MAKQIKWKYCVSTTKSIISQFQSTCLQDINQIIVSEGGKNPPFTKEIAVNLDQYEVENAKKSKRNRYHTMDMVFAVIDHNSKYIILTELRLKYRNVNNLRKSELVQKINDSKQIIGYSITFFSTYYFIFKNNLVQQASNKLRRLFLNKSNYVAINIYDLKSKFF